MTRILPYTVAFDAEKLLHEVPTGVERYVQALIWALGRLDEPLPSLQYILPQTKRARSLLPKGAAASFARSERLYGELWLPLAVRRVRPTLTFLPARPLPLLFKVPEPIFVVHDLAYLHFPDHYEPKARWLMKQRMAWSIRRAAQIITVSAATKRDVIRHYPEARGKTTAIPLGVDHEIYRPDPPMTSTAIEKVQSWMPFFLYTGRLEKRKNITTLIEAFRLLLHEQDFRHNLVLLGSPGYGHDEIQEVVRALGTTADRIIQPGYVSDEVKNAALHAAEAFVFPSNYEGSSLPILEAQASGLPVITSKGGAMAEVAGDGALLVDPAKPLEIAGAMSRILHDEALRRDLVRRGITRASQFTWERTARETLQVWTEAAERVIHHTGPEGTR